MARIRPIRCLLLTLGVLAVSGASSALADEAASTNWSGYAVHRVHVAFHSVAGDWRVPRAICTPGQDRYSAMWIGLGGYSASSQALEQTGIEVDCSASGRGVYSAWYELVPADPVNISLSIHPGDLMRGGVTAIGHRVTLTLRNLTRHRSFSRTFHPSLVDDTSADWILEAPSACLGLTCEILPLTDFGKAAFTDSRVSTTTGRAGAISSHWWGNTRIILTSGGRQFVSGSSLAAAGLSVPSTLTAGGLNFSIGFQQSAEQPPPSFSSGSGLAGRLRTVHPRAGGVRVVHPRVH